MIGSHDSGGVLEYTLENITKTRKMSTPFLLLLHNYEGHSTDKLFSVQS